MNTLKDLLERKSRYVPVDGMAFLSKVVPVMQFGEGRFTAIIGESNGSICLCIVLVEPGEVARKIKITKEDHDKVYPVFEMRFPDKGSINAVRNWLDGVEEIMDKLQEEKEVVNEKDKTSNKDNY